MSRILIAYYSFTGSTRNLAIEIARQTGGDLRELIPEEGYSFERHAAAGEVRRQIQRGYCPRLVEGNGPIDGYDTLFIGSPNWFRKMAPPIASFLAGRDLSNRTLIPFCTHGGGGIGDMVRDLTAAYPSARVLQGPCLSGEVNAEAVSEWLARLGAL